MLVGLEAEVYGNTQELKITDTVLRLKFVLTGL